MAFIGELLYIDYMVNLRQIEDDMAIRKKVRIGTRKLIKELIDTGSITEAAMRTGNHADREAAYQSGNRRLKQIGLAGEAKVNGGGPGDVSNLGSHTLQILDQAGLTDEYIAQRLMKKTDATKVQYFTDKGVVVDSREGPDHGVQLKAIEMAGKWKGFDVKRSLSMNLNVKKDMNASDLENMTPEELDYYLESISASLQEG